MKPVFFMVLVVAVSVRLHAQEFRAYSADRLMQRVSDRDTVYVVNFWATWCVPCVRELPSFDSLQLHYSGKPVKVLLVSLDFPEDYETKLSRFVEKRKPLPEIVWFSDTNANEFIPKIDDRWSGALPGTLIIRGDDKDFLERSIHMHGLLPIIDARLK